MSTGPAATPPPTAPPSQPAGTAPVGAPGSAPEQQQGQDTGGLWGRFPNVPAEHREMLEPHLKGVQAHVTRLEQQLAPFKGMTPQAMRGLGQFAKQFDANPKGMFLSIAADLQRRGILHENLDLEALQAVVDGQIPDETGDAAGDEWGQEGQDWVWEGSDGEDPWANAPAWALELRQQQQAQQEKEAQAARENQERVEDAMLTKVLGTMRERLKAAGYTDEYLTDQRLQAQLLTHAGNAEAAVQDAVNARNQILGSVVKPKPKSGVELPKGVPPHAKTVDPTDGLKRRDPIKAAGAGAEQYLRRAAQESQ